MRLAVSRACDPETKSRFAQFFTPATIARFMAGLFPRQAMSTCRLLDAGAGIGSLSAAFLERWLSGELHFHRAEVDAFEIDTRLHPYLSETLAKYEGQLNVAATIRGDDFIRTAVDSLSGSLFGEPLPRYTHAILNPPYKKIRANSVLRLALREVGIETVNLYSAFVALALALLQDRGQLVAIVPRSFCNGPYYRSFRRYILQRATIKRMHLFASRNKAFKDDEVLQENVIVLLVRGELHSKVAITTSTDASFHDMQSHEYAFDQIVFPGDSECFIHVPTSPELGRPERSGPTRYLLDDIGVSVSTGPVVDFRLKEHLRNLPEQGTVPLLYATHFKKWAICWPQPGSKKPNAIQRNDNTEKWLYPTGFYCVVRRFSSKEEERRIVASVVTPDDFPDAEMLGFENHLNVFHVGKHGLPKSLAYGLATFLNSTSVDQAFRRFNGHTQVNATDLRNLRYPHRRSLVRLGQWAMRCREPQQSSIDKQVENLEHGQEEP